MLETAISQVTMNSNEDEQNQKSLVETLFWDPEAVSEGEYWAIYEFLQDPNICDDPVAIAGSLQEFAEWTQFMLEQIKKRGFGEQSKT